MLTKNDLLQIRTVVRDEIQEELKPVRIDIAVLKKGQISIKGKLDTLHKNLHSFVDHSDKRLTNVEQDVKKLQQN